jgi:hypothetical protein
MGRYFINFTGRKTNCLHEILLSSKSWLSCIFRQTAKKFVNDQRIFLIKRIKEAGAWRRNEAVTGRRKAARKSERNEAEIVGRKEAGTSGRKGRNWWEKGDKKWREKGGRGTGGRKEDGIGERKKARTFTSFAGFWYPAKKTFVFH